MSPRILLAILILALPSLAAAEKLEVFVSVPPQVTFVKKVGGDHVEVQSMVRPGYSPATYEPTPRQIAALARTQLYIRIGVPFEAAWMKRLRAANPKMKVVDARDAIHLPEFRPTERVGEHDSHGHASDLDPHIWTSPPLVKQMAAGIRDTLTELDPQNASDYAKGYERFAAELDALDAEIRAMLKGLKNRRFMVFHPAWGYFADTYGLIQVPIEKEGKEPGARALTALIEQAKREHIKVIFVQPQFYRRSAEQVARAIGGWVVAIDPLATDYISNLREAARQIAEALRQ